MRSSRLLFVALAGLPLLLSADAPDPIRDRLDAGRKTYEQDSEKTKKQFLSDLQARIDEAQQAGETDVVNTVTAERKAFEATGTLPMSKVSRRIAVKFENNLYSVMQQWKYVMEKTQKEYTKAGMRDKANNMKVEVEEFQKVVESRFPERKRRDNKILNGKFEQKFATVHMSNRLSSFRSGNANELSERDGLVDSRSPLGRQVFSGKMDPRTQWLFLSSPGNASYNHGIDNDGMNASKCLRISGDKGVGTVDAPAVKADFKKRYTACGWVRVDKDATVSIAFDYFNANGGRIKTTETDFTDLHKSESWQYVENSDRLDEVPSATHLRVALKVVNFGTAWFDDIQLIVADK